MSPGEILKRNKHSDCVVLKSENTGDKDRWKRTLEHKQWNCKTNSAGGLSRNLPRNPSCKLSDMRQSTFTAKMKGPELQLHHQSTCEGISCGCLCAMGISVRKHIPLSCGGEERVSGKGSYLGGVRKPADRFQKQLGPCNKRYLNRFMQHVSVSLVWQALKVSVGSCLGGSFLSFFFIFSPFGLSVARCLWERGSTFWSTPK